MSEPSQAAEKAQRPLYVLPDRWDHAIRAANRFARRDGVRYQIRWFQPRGCWIVRSSSEGSCAMTAEKEAKRGMR